MNDQIDDQWDNYQTNQPASSDGLKTQSNVMKGQRNNNALGIALLYLFLSGFIILIFAYYYQIDYIFWTYLFTALLLTLAVSYIIWYSYLIGNTILCILFWILGLLVLILLSYFVLATHSRNITVVIQSM